MTQLTTIDETGPELAIAGQLTRVGDISDSVAAIGAGAQVIYTKIERALTRVEELEQAEAYARQRLADAVKAHVERMQRQVESSPSRSDRGNPYKALLPYELGDARGFFGRAAAVRELASATRRAALTVLYADAGVGKTSLVKAGLLPRLLAESDVPVVVRPGHTPVTRAVKRALLTQSEHIALLSDASLRDFVRRVTDLLDGQRLVVILDQFEEMFSAQTAQARAEFTAEWAACLDDDVLPVSWIVVVRSQWFAHLSAFQPQVRQPFGNVYRLDAFDRREARSVATLLARRARLRFEPALLAQLIQDLGPDRIAPPQLQIVCHTLVETLAAGERRLTLGAYERLGRAGSILRGYLDDAIERSLPPAERAPAWTVLAALGDHEAGRDEAALASQVSAHGIGPAQTRRVIGLLEASRLVQNSDGRYRLASDSLLPRIRAWAAERAVAELARAETARQIERIRNSALRGMLGGALGFCLAFLIIYAPQTTNPWLLPYITAVRAVPGGLAGLLLIFSIDVAMASTNGRKRRLRWIAGGLAGAGSFALAVSCHSLLRSQAGLSALLPSALEGAVWGLVSGIGAVWMMSQQSRRAHTLAKTLIAALAGGVALGLVDAALIDNAFGNPPSPMLVGVGGAVMPLCVLAVAVLASAASKELAS